MDKKGIDISAYQGAPDFDKVFKDGIEFVMIRAGWGVGTIDKQFERNARECKRLGKPFGAYWFIYALNDNDVKRNAQACITALKDKKLDYPVGCDLEYDTISYAARHKVYIDKATASRWAKIFLDTVKAAGFQVCNYTNYDYYRRYFDDSVNKGYDLWYAWWSSASVISNKSDIWQYTSKGRVSGIAGNVDMNMAHKQYPASNPADITPVPVNPSKDYYPIPAVYTLVFDPEFYLAKYPDLQDAVKVWIENGTIKNEPGAIAWQIYQHFLMFGMNEARQGNSVFDVKKYKEAYADLQAAFGDEWKAYYYHYMQYGAKEIATGQRANFMK